jgi:WD40 repeat protein
VLERAVAGEPDARYASAAELARALEEVTLRVEGAETLEPYPGLAAFTEDDAEYFFGRELEVEAMWKKLRRPHLLALIGPSGAGKSSFLRAGLLANTPPQWGHLICTPGPKPFTALGRALADELAGDTDAMKQLLEFEEPTVALSVVSRWRQRHKHALVIVDQFEELFTLSPLRAQERFAALLSRFALDADVHVLLSMRDDFLFRCHQFDSLAPIFSELTPLGLLSGSSLRRALVQPALKCGYRFEDDSLVDEMVSEVEEERGALPLVAFTAARLWERKDHEEGLLTRAAYGEIGGVGGALAQHAEATLERIGNERIPVVREIFRNLVTAQGTRAARDREELLSVFGETGDREAAAEVLDRLIDARLLTSFEVSPVEGEKAGHHRIEIIHESLLSHWPRLVRWQTQDQEGAQLRDELRQSSAMWKQHGRSDDLLWTGTAFEEFQLWHQRYPGGLSELEESFADAMVTHAERRKRRRRLAVAVAFILLLVVLGIVGASRQQAVAEARRAEAAKLLALAQVLRGDDPTEALAYTSASLDLADSDDARMLALELLWEASPALEVEPGGTLHNFVTFSPDGSRLALFGYSDEVRVFSATGGAPMVLSAQTDGSLKASWASNELLVTTLKAGWLYSADGRFRIWSFPGGRLVRELDAGGRVGWLIRDGFLLAWVEETDSESGHKIFRLRRWSLPDGEAEELGRVDATTVAATDSEFDSRGRGWIYLKGNEILYRPLPVREGVADRFLGRHDNAARFLWRSKEKPRRFWTRDVVTSELRLWDPTSPEPEPLQVVTRPDWLEEGVLPFPEVRWAGSNLGNTQWRQIRFWDLEGWPEARPLRLRRSGSWSGAQDFWDPSRNWTVAITRNMSRLTFWPLTRTGPRVVDGYAAYVRFLCFSSDNRWLATSWTTETDVLRLWPMPGNDTREVRSLALPAKQTLATCAFDSRGRFLFTVGMGSPLVVPLDGSPPRPLDGPASGSIFFAASVSPSGRRVATAFGCQAGSKTLWLWDLGTGERRAFDLPESSASTSTGCEGVIADIAFVDESTLYTAGDGGVRRWDLESGAHELVLGTGSDSRAYMRIAARKKTALVQARPIGGGDLGVPTIVDLVTGTAQTLPQFAGDLREKPASLSIDSSGTVVAVGDSEGVIRVGRPTADEPHLLTGHEGAIAEVAISPDGQWIASTGEDNTLRLWPMPDLDKPPLHTLPRDELLTKLRSLTNLRAVRDEASSTGWSIELDPFPGWQEVPTW